jgi:hypothetical protein
MKRVADAKAANSPHKVKLNMAKNATTIAQGFLVVARTELKAAAARLFQFQTSLFQPCFTLRAFLDAARFSYMGTRASMF